MSATKLGQQEAPERLKLFEIIWVKSGEGTLTVDMQKYCIPENTIYCLAPGQYRLLQATGPMEGYYISASAEFLYLTESHTSLPFLAAQYREESSLSIVRPNAEMEEVIRRIHKEYGNHHSLRTEILKGLLKIFMLYLSRQTDAQNIAVQYNKDAEVVRKFMNLLREHFATKKLVADYADELCITPNYLNSIVKKLTGFPVSHHIQQYIIMEAKRQARYSNLRMKEIADRLGFEDHAHFSKFFKNYSGMNFSSFRKALQ
jgi:AraC-like DNA-binding protein